MDLVYLQSELVRVGHGDGLSLFAVCIGTGRSFAVCIGTGRSFAVCIGCIGLGRSWRLDLVYLKSSLVRVGHLQFALVALVRVGDGDGLSLFAVCLGTGRLW